MQHLHKVIEGLVEKVASQGLELSGLKEEMAELKKEPKKPKIKPSKLDEAKDAKKGSKESKRTGSEKRKKKKGLVINEKRKVKAKGGGSRLDFGKLQALCYTGHLNTS